MGKQPATGSIQLFYRGLLAVLRIWKGEALMANEKKKNTTVNPPVAEEEEADYLTLEFDDGTQVECMILGVFDCEGKEYMALVPDDDSEDVYLYGYREKNEEEFELLDITDDEEFEKVAAEFDLLAVND